MATNDIAVEKNPILFAFEGNASDDFLGWVKALSDLMACGDPDQCEDRTFPECSRLIYLLTEAAEGLAKDEGGIDRAPSAAKG